MLPKQTLVLAIVEKGAQGCLGSLANLVQPEIASIVRKILIKYYINSNKKMKQVILQEDWIVRSVRGRVLGMCARTCDGLLPCSVG